MPVVFNPATRHVNAPAVALQRRLFPAAVAAEPAVAVIAETKVGG
jgi:hypothetical protein